MVSPGYPCVLPGAWIAHAIPQVEWQTVIIKNEVRAFSCSERELGAIYELDGGSERRDRRDEPRLPIEAIRVTTSGSAGRDAV